MQTICVASTYISWYNQSIKSWTYSYFGIHCKHALFSLRFDSFFDICSQYHFLNSSVCILGSREKLSGFICNHGNSTYSGSCFDFRDTDILVQKSILPWTHFKRNSPCFGATRIFVCHWPTRYRHFSQTRDFEFQDRRTPLLYSIFARTYDTKYYSWLALIA